MPQHHETPSTEAPAGDTLTVEAATVEDALSRVTDQLGPEAQIVDARKVQRGGFKGFFAKEMVQLTAAMPGRRPLTGPAAPVPQAVPPVRSPRTRPADRAVEALLARTSPASDEPDFGTYLRRELGAEDADLLPAPPAAADTETTNESAPLDAVTAHPDVEDLPAPKPVGPLTRDPRPLDGTPGAATSPPAPSSTPPGVAPAVAAAPALHAAAQAAAPARPGATLTTAPARSEPAAPDWRLQHPDSDTPAGLGPVAWSTTALARLGLPEAIISAVGTIDPADDLGWINGIAAAAARFCAPPSDAPAVIAGPNADRVGGALGVPVVFPQDMPPYAGTVGAVVTSDPKDTTWLEYILGDRDLHLVIGDEHWRAALVKDPATVSWVGDTGVVDALYLCATLGAKLGYGTTAGPLSGLVRVRPVDVALAVRQIVGRL